MRRFSGQEPGLSQNWQGQSPDDVSYSGREPMLGGWRRPRLDRTLFWDLLDLDGGRRLQAIEQILEQGAGHFYAAAMVAVLAPGARYFETGHLWKVPYSYERKLAAMDSLLRLDPGRALSGLIVALNNQDLGIQRAAILFMGQLDTEQAEAALLAVLDDSRPEIRQVGFHALSSRWGLPDLKNLVNPSTFVVSETARWLGLFGPVRAIRPLIAALHDRRADLSENALAQSAITEAIALLAQRPDAEDRALAVQELSALLADRQTSPVVAERAAGGLRQIGTPEARAAVIRYQAARHG